MSYSRYTKRSMILNDDVNYQKSLFSDRGIKQVMQYETPVFSYPTNGEMAGALEIETVRWGATHKLYNLAEEFYGEPELWWVIAWFNRKPTEGHFSIGDVVYIPQPIDAAMAIFERSQP